MTVITIIISVLGSVLQRFGKDPGRVGNRRTNLHFQNYSIIKFDQNTEKSSRNLKRLPVIQTPVKDHYLTLAGKTKKYIMIITILLF